MNLLNGLLKKWQWLVGGLLLAAVAAFMAITPSNSRNWTTDQALWPKIEVADGKVTIRNLRNFAYRTAKDYDPVYYEKTLDPATVNSLWMVVEPFSSWQGIAHVFFTFGFTDRTYLGISVEIRKEQGEAYSPWRGLWKNYELMYVLGDERDLIRLRSNFRHDPVYLFPIKIPQESMQNLLMDMLLRARDMENKPEFYNTLFNACTTNMAWHMNRVLQKKLPWDWRVYVPGYIDQFFYEQGLIQTTLPYEKIREHFLINPRAEAADQAADFSAQIRQFGPEQ